MMEIINLLFMARDLFVLAIVFGAFYAISKGLA
jgi:hypothetical protein